MQIGLFVTILITVKGIKIQTVDHYASHVIERWIKERQITHSDDVCTPYLVPTIGFERVGRVVKLIRDEAKIALTYPLLLTVIRVTDEQDSE